jgi:CheY-like chemotaxis protein
MDIPIEAGPQTQGQIRVFIAEDNPILLQGLERALSANGYQVTTAADGPAVLDLLAGDPLPDLLLLDVMMPGMSGIEVLDTVRATPRTAAIPVMLITAAAEEVVPGSALSARNVEVLMKPFRLSDLLERLQAQVAESRGTRPGATDRSESVSTPS